MNRLQFLSLNKNGYITILRSIPNPNIIPSDTDPTQNVRVSQVFNAMIEGRPLDLRQYKQVFSRIPADQMTAIDRRNNDSFDAYREMKGIQGGLQKTIKKQSKKQQKDETEEN